MRNGWRLAGLFMLIALIGSVSRARALDTLSYAAYLSASGDIRGAQTLALTPEERTLSQNETGDFTVVVPESGLYALSYEYMESEGGMIEAEAELRLNGEIPYRNLSRVVFSTLWESREEVFLRDRYGNEIVPMQQKKEGWRGAYLTDSGEMEPYPLLLWCEKGENTLSFTLTAGEITLRGLRLSPPVSWPTYDEYLETLQGAEKASDFCLTLEAEKPSYKNCTMVIPKHDKELLVTPYETYTRPLNVIDETTWILGGDTLYYEIEIPKDGLYALAFHYRQTDKPNVRVYRRVTVDGLPPYQELATLGFDYSEDWRLHIPSNDSGEPYYAYLTEGRHVLGVGVDASPYLEIVASLNQCIDELSDLYIELKKVVGGGEDALRDWDIADYFPDLTERLTAIKEELLAQSAILRGMNNGQRNSDQQAYVTLAVKELEYLLRAPETIPKKAGHLTEGSGSVAQQIAKAVSDINMQAMALDKIFVFSEGSAPRIEKQGFLTRASEWCKRFFATFTKSSRGERDDSPSLTVWVGRSRNYVEVMQRLTDADFTPRTGIRVNYELLADEHKLTLSAIADVAPDAAMGLSTQLPYEMGIRGIAYNLREFSDFGEQIGKFSPGAFLSLTADGEVYGLPETQGFHVLFYRKDILDMLNLPVPKTWEDVRELMPELARYGMNFYTDLASSSGSKSLVATAPFIFQYGGELYTKDGMRTAIDGEKAVEALRLMCDLSTVYGLSLQVNSFFESFRSGITPLGVADFSTYVEMLVAAPELMNRWAIAPAPGVRDENGVIQRQYPGLASACMILSTSEKKEEAWQLLNWWMETETQSEYALQMKTIYGTDYLYPSANPEAFKNLPIANADKAVILTQWESLRELQFAPGWYMIERELSNVWNSVVFEGAKLRDRLDAAVTLINREIERRMTDFGYVENGRMVRPYEIYTVEDIEAWAADER